MLEHACCLQEYLLACQIGDQAVHIQNPARTFQYSMSKALQYLALGSKTIT